MVQTSTMGIGVTPTDLFVQYTPPVVDPTGTPIGTNGVGLGTDGTFVRYIPPSVIPEPPPPEPPVNLTPPVANATTLNQGGMALTTNGTWAGLMPRTYTYQWQVAPAGTPIPGATSQTWTITGYDGESIQCLVTATNADGTASQLSNIIGPIEAATEPPP